MPEKSPRKPLLTRQPIKVHFLINKTETFNEKNAKPKINFEPALDMIPESSASIKLVDINLSRSIIIEKNGASEGSLVEPNFRANFQWDPVEENRILQKAFESKSLSFSQEIEYEDFKKVTRANHPHLLSNSQNRTSFFDNMVQMGQGSSWRTKLRTTFRKMFSLSNTKKEAPGFKETLLYPVIKKAIMKLRNKTFYKKLDQAKIECFHILGDKSHFVRESFVAEPKIMFLKFISLIKSNIIEFSITAFVKIPKFLLFSTLSTIHPHSKIKYFWDFFYLLCSIMFIIVMPFSFVTNVSGFIIAFLIFHFIQMVINFNLGFYSHGAIVMDKEEIVKKYLSSKFIKDVLVLIPAALAISLIDSPISIPVKFLFILQFSSGKRCINNLIDVIRPKHKNKIIIDLLVLLFFCLFICHLFACIWFFLGLDAVKYGNSTWMHTQSVDKMEWWTQYIYSYYWSTVTIMTVGYGDFTPQSYAEILYSVLTILIGGAMFLYNINYLGFLLSELNKETKELKSILTVIEDFMERKNISFDLQAKIKHYLQFISTEKSFKNKEEESKAIGKLSNSLKEELMLEANSSILKKIPMFLNNFSSKTLNSLICIMKEVHFSPNDIVIMESEADDQNIYFINSGRIELFKHNEHNDQVIKIKDLGVAFFVNSKEGEIFGEMTFFTGMPHACFAKSTDFTLCFIIEKKAFMDIIKGDHKEYERFCQLKDSLLLYKDPTNLSMRCYGCQQKDHLSFNCPSMHFVPDRERILKAYDFSHTQPRYSVFRDVKRYNCMFNANSIREEWEDISRNEWFIYDKIDYYKTLERLKVGIGGDDDDYSDNDASFFRDERVFIRKGKNGKTTLISSAGENSFLLRELQRNEARRSIFGVQAGMQGNNFNGTVNEDGMAPFTNQAGSFSNIQGVGNSGSMLNISGNGLQTEYNQNQGGNENSFTEEMSYAVYEPYMRSNSALQQTNISKRSAASIKKPKSVSNSFMGDEVVKGDFDSISIFENYYPKSNVNGIIGRGRKQRLTQVSSTNRYFLYKTNIEKKQVKNQNELEFNNESDNFKKARTTLQKNKSVFNRNITKAVTFFDVVAMLISNKDLKKKLVSKK